MKLFNLFVGITLLGSTACTLDKTDYEAEINTEIPQHSDFMEAVSFDSGAYKITIETLNGDFYIGYNEIRLHVADKHTGESANVSEITFWPLSTNAEGEKSSCPHQYNPKYNREEKYYTGYVVFTTRSTIENWQLYIRLSVDGQTHEVNRGIVVQQQTNKNLNMTSFTGNDGEYYIIALVAPQRPVIGENKLVAGIYKANSIFEENYSESPQFAYAVAEGYTLELDPRMPEPSMGNHSSPNNVDLTQKDDGLYHGVVNYTMTGNWTLNFILKNSQGAVVKGTKVPTDFTPGQEGVKSELHIDILF